MAILEVISTRRSRMGESIRLEFWILSSGTNWPDILFPGIALAYKVTPKKQQGVGLIRNTAEHV